MILTNLNKRDFEKILLNYEIGDYKSHTHMPIALSNTIFILTTTKGKYVLKIFEESSNFLVYYQLKIMDFLGKNNIPTQKIMKTKKGTSITRYNGKKIGIFEYIEGQHVKKFTKEIIEEFALNVALLHKALLKLNFKKNVSWGNHQFRKSKKFIIKESNGFELRKEFNSLVDETKANVDETKLRKCIIHSDIAGVNSVFRKNKLVAFIDWDDVHLDYLVYDMSVFISDNLITDKYATKLFLNAYSKELYLNFEEKKAVYYFIKNRALSSINWNIRCIGKHKDTKDEIIKNINKDIKKYNEFCKVSLKEFLALFKL